MYYATVMRSRVPEQVMWFQRGILIFLLFAAVPGWATTSQQIFSDAQAAYKAQDEKALQRHAAALQASGYVLAPYVDYWRLLLRLEQAESEEVRAFLARYAELPFSERVRAEWLKKLGKRGEWGVFFEELPKLQENDAAVACYALLGRAQQGGDLVLAEARSIWLRPSSQPEACDAVFARMIAAGLLTPHDIWQRVHLALEAGNISVAKAALLRMPDYDSASAKYLDDAYENPQRVLQKKRFGVATRLGRELNLYALERVSRNQAELALALWQELKPAYTRQEQQSLWARMALHAARRHDARALQWYAYAEDLPLSEEQALWKARAALRAQRWDVLLATIAAMPKTLQEEDAWRYWMGRALKEQGQVAAANAVLLPVAGGHTFYGLLAEEELGPSIGARTLPSYRPGETEVREIEKLPGIQRAQEFYRLDMRWEGQREWRWATRNFDDKQLLAAAELAFRERQYDLAINTADKTSLIHDFALRYPTPYRETMRAYAGENGLDEAWVYGLIRQESRFVSQARSRVGASGLMQVMPATARWIAKRMGEKDFRSDMIYQLDTNIRYGTHYLRYTMERAGGQPVIATAAYNAGPGRAQRWRPAAAMEGAIYAETIPFSETRDYVKKVMGNAYFYAHRLGERIQSMRQRLGTIPGSATAGGEDGES